MKEFDVDGITMRLGETAKENWQLIGESNSDHMWMHLNSYPSGHIVIKSDNVTDELLQEAAQLCKENTKYRNLRNLKRCYTKVSNLKYGEKAGSVHFKSNRQVKTIKI